MSTTAFTVTDLYCGAGGSTTGAAAVPGVEVRQAFNHWERAIETLDANHDGTEAIRSDLLDVHPACFEPMTMLLASPECKTHSPGSGTRRKNLQQGEIFEADRCDLSPETLRSRATMHSVCHWASVHRPEFVVVENVVEIHYWPEFEGWLREFETMGYDHERVYVNGLFVHGLTDARVSFRMPQSRDRIYVVFWKRGNPKPDLTIRPLAPCPSCAGEVRAVQAWKPARTWGKYRRQYVYRCPHCRAVVEPWYYPAATAIDWTNAGIRIGDREAHGLKPLAEKTIARIEYGLKRFGLRPYTVATRYSSGVECRVRDVDAPMPCQPTQEVLGLAGAGLAGALAVELGRSDHAGKCRPVGTNPLATQTTAHTQALVVETAFSHSGDDRVRRGEQPLPTQTVRNTQALVYANRTNGTLRAADSDPMHALTTGENLALLTPCRTNGRTVPADAAPMGAVTAGGTHHGLVTGAQVTLRGTRSLDGLDDPMGAACTTAIQTGVLTREPFVVSYYGSDQAARTTDPLGTVTTLARHALVDGAPAPSVEDLYFRMFDVPELLVGTGYALGYRLFGTKRDRVRLIGGSNYSGIEQLLVQRCLDTLA